jgi:hypothetical protein
VPREDERKAGNGTERRTWRKEKKKEKIKENENKRRVDTVIELMKRR